MTFMLHLSCRLLITFLLSVFTHFNCLSRLYVLNNESYSAVKQINTYNFLKRFSSVIQQGYMFLLSENLIPLFTVPNNTGLNKQCISSHKGTGVGRGGCLRQKKSYRHHRIFSCQLPSFETIVYILIIKVIKLCIMCNVMTF